MSPKDIRHVISWHTSPLALDTTLHVVTDLPTDPEDPDFDANALDDMMRKLASLVERDGYENVEVSYKSATMPKGPKGEKRPADVIGAAVEVR